MYYAGIGSRETPQSVLNKMTELASSLSEKGLILNSGGAPGADTAFYQGSRGKHQIFVPWDGFQGHRKVFRIYEEAFNIASKLHPAWGYLQDSVKLLMARNVHQVLGSDLKTPVEFVICWTPDGCVSHKQRTKKTGGTGLAISVASVNGIPVFNLNDRTCLEFVEKDLLNAITKFVEIS